MSELEILIQELCPNGVEYKTIGDVCDITRGKVMSKDFIRDNEGEYPVYSSQTENNGELGKINTYMFDGEYISWTTDGANAGTVFYRSGKFSITNVCGLLKIKESNLNCKFLYYYLTTATEPHVNKGMGNAKLMSNVMATIKVPIPPMEVQSEIVRILDNFTLLTAELIAELTARKQQYEYYRDTLLTFNEEIKYEKLYVTNKLLRGQRLTTRDMIEDGKYAVYHGGNKPIGYYNAANRKGDTVMIINVGASAGTIGYSNDEFWSSDGCFCLEHSAKFINKFLYHYLCIKQDYLISKVRRAGIPTLDNSVVENIMVPQISIKIQKRIVEVLDNFEKICSDLNIGLPAEIEARKQQYEFYRTKLLTMLSEGVNLSKQASKQASKIDSNFVAILQYIFGYVVLSIEEVVEFKVGGDAPKNNMSKQKNLKFNVPILSNGIGDNSIYGYTNESKIDVPAVTVSARGTIGWVNYIDEPFFPIVRLICLIPNKLILPKYLKYYLETIKFEVPKVGIPQLTVPMIKEKYIVFPSLGEQQRIVDILDKFELYCNDITEGLPAEIELRQHQYEYYRNKLLTFKEIE